MFKKILIANRGEIACRIARTCEQLGIKSVGIYSDADADALHTRICDEAEWVGESESSASYLNVSRIIEIAKESGADAIHPGYGFLSENASFAAQVAKSGLVFIGPTPEVIKLLGDKVLAKGIAQKVSAPTIQGISLEALDPKPVQAFVKKTGYPILIKAAAGGGGRGMRKVYAESELIESLESASREAKSFFGDGRVFIEQLIENARHVEVQILGDHHGNVMHLGTRDCSFQRNHQKVIEEAPAPALSDSLREQIHNAALKICKEVKYTNAGTVEFLVLGDAFYFLEVNSRLQVEHPVTEAVYGVDLVELQIRIASGESLAKLLPNGVKPTGHAIQCRICTEIPRRGFQADTGLVLACSVPDDVRFDTGYEAGSTVSHYYDSLFAKLITHASSREDAIIDSIDAIESVHIAGVQTNTEFLLSLLFSPSFHSAAHHTYSTHSILEEMQNNYSETFAALSVLLLNAPYGQNSPWNNLDGFRIAPSPALSRSITVSGNAISLKGVFSTENQVQLSSLNLTVTHNRLDVNTIELLCGDENILIEGHRYGNTYWISGSLGQFAVTLSTERLKRDSSLKGHLGGEIRSPLPGKILSVKITPGDAVEVGTPLLVLESMKMEHSVIAHQSGIVESIAVALGASVSRDQLLCKIVA